MHQYNKFMLETQSTFFNSFNPKSKVWIFQANRLLNIDETTLLKEKGDLFTNQWKAHGADLKAGCTLINQIFYVFVSDETFNAVGGCSIDKLIQFVKSVETEISIDFFNRLNIAYRLDSNIKICGLQEIKIKIANQEINENTMVYNNAIDTIEKLRTEWVIPLNKSFLKKYLKSEAIG